MDRRTVLRLSLMTPIGVAIAAPAGAVPTLPKRERVYYLDPRATLLHESILKFIKHYRNLSAEPAKYVDYKFRYPYAALAGLSVAEVHAFLIQDATDWFAIGGPCSHLGWIRGLFKIIEAEGVVTTHTKLPNRYPYDSLEEIELAEHWLSLVENLLWA